MTYLRQPREENSEVSEMFRKSTTAVDDIDKKEPTNTPSDNFAPHNYKVNRFWSLATIYIRATKPDSIITVNIIIDYQHHTMAVTPHKNINIIIWSSPPRTATGPTAFNCINKGKKCKI